MKSRQKRNIVFSIALLAMILFAFGCSSPSGGTTTTGTPVIMSGAMTKGSVILNGVHFQVAAGASISVNGVSGKLETDLSDGMMVKIHGTINNDGVTGSTDIIDCRNELQGQVTAVNGTAVPPNFVVLGQTVFVNSQTIFVGGPSLDASGNLIGLAVNDWVEVHGQRDASGNIRATRLVKETAAVEIELKGTIQALVGTTFSLGTLTVDASTATVVPSGATLANGERVEVKGAISGTTLTATSVEIEYLAENPMLHPSDGMETSVQGFVTNLTPTADGFTFTIGTQNIITNATTIYKNGSALNLINNVMVEVEGTMSGANLIAREVKFDEMRIELVGAATAYPGTSITIFDTVVIQISSLTNKPATITVGSRYKVEAYISGANIIAEEITAVGAGSDKLQAGVTAESGTPNWTMTLLGITANLTNATFNGLHGVVLTRDAFFAAVTPNALGGTPICVTGTYATGTLTATEADLED